MGILFKNAQIITDCDQYLADVHVKGEKIVNISTNLKGESDDRIIDASGNFLIPGGVDPHTHLDLPFMGTVTRDDFESGTIAAAAGGTTTIIDFAIPGKNESFLKALNTWKNKAEGKAAIDYGLHMAVTWWDDSAKKELPECLDEGVSSFKIFLAYKGSLGVDDAQMFEIMECAKKFGCLIMVHAENAEIVWQLQNKFLKQGKTQPIHHAHSRPPFIEGEGTHRSVTMARVFDMPVYIVHMSAKDALEKIRDAVFRGENAIAETCPQYLLLDETSYEKPGWEGAKWVMSPPLRSKEHCEALWRGVKGGMIKTIGTDHCSFDFRGQKDMAGKDDFTKIPNGIPGIQDRMTLIYTFGVMEGRIDRCRWIELCCANPAKIFGLYPKKGTIKVGSDADIVLWDPAWTGILSRETSFHKNDYNAFEGFGVQGKPSIVTSRGKIIFENGKYAGKPGEGKFLRRSMLY
jgi:dihydropyrimidinase